MLCYMALVGSSTSSIQLAKSDGATSLTVLTDADIAGTANIYVSGHYEVKWNKIILK